LLKEPEGKSPKSYEDRCYVKHGAYVIEKNLRVC